MEIAEVCWEKKEFFLNPPIFLQLFIKIYPDQLQRSPAVETLVERVWSLVGSNKLPNISDDIVGVWFSTIFVSSH